MRKQDDHTCPWSRWWAYVTLLCLMAVAFPCGMAAGPDATKAPQKALPSAAPDVKLKLTPKQLAALNTGFSNLLQQRQTLLQSNTTSQQPGNSSNPVSTAGSYLNSLVNKLNQELEESEQQRIKHKHGHKRREHHHRHEDSTQPPQYEPEAQPEYHRPAPGPHRPWAHQEPPGDTRPSEGHDYMEQKGDPEQDRHYLQHSHTGEQDSDEANSRHRHQHYPEPEELHSKMGPRHIHHERREPSYESPAHQHSPDAEEDSPMGGHRQRSRQDAEGSHHEHGADEDSDEDDGRHTAPKSAVLCVRESYRKACSLSDTQDERQTVYYTSKLECCPGNGEVDDTYQGAPMPEAAVKVSAVNARKKGVVGRATQIRVPSPHANKSGCSWKVTYLDEPEKVSPTISRIGFGVAVCQFTEEIESCSGVVCKGLKFKAKVDVFKTSAISEYPPPAGGLDGSCSDVYDHIGLHLADASDSDVSAANAKRGKATDEVRTAEYNMFYDSLIAQGPGQRIYGGEAIIMTGPISAIYVRPGEPSVKYKSGMLEHVAAFSGRVLSTAEMLELPKDTPFVKPKAYKLLMVPSQSDH